MTQSSVTVCHPTRQKSVASSWHDFLGLHPPTCRPFVFSFLQPLPPPHRVRRCRTERPLSHTSLSQSVAREYPQPCRHRRLLPSQPLTTVARPNPRAILPPIPKVQAKHPPSPPSKYLQVPASALLPRDRTAPSSPNYDPIQPHSPLPLSTQIPAHGLAHHSASSTVSLQKMQLPSPTPSPVKGAP